MQKQEFLIERINALEKELASMKSSQDKHKNIRQQLFRRTQELDALMKAAQAVLEQKTFTVTARGIFDYCRNLIGASSGYVALLNDDGSENEVLFLESGGLPCDVNPDLPMPIRGLRAEAYRNGKAVYHNNFMNSKWIKFMPPGHVVLNNVMFAPLVIEKKVVGLIGLANKPADFDDADAKIAQSFGELAAIALQNSQNLAKRIRVEEQQEALIQDLENALAHVKQLSGLLPICSICKKIRDDKGYWNQIESYIQDRTDAQFTHSICKSCVKEYYPEYSP